MEVGNKLLNFSHYVVLLAHPDDEIYICNLIASLVHSEKVVDVIYVTSGDYHGEEVGRLREQEAFESMRLIGIQEDRIHFLRAPERELISRLKEVLSLTLDKIQTLRPDCIISHDFEGGHNHHDTTSFYASKISEQLNIPLYVFPAYYGWPEYRLFNQFVDPSKVTYTNGLDASQKDFKIKVMSAHKSQWGGFMEAIEQSKDQLFFEREVLRLVDSPIDYTQEPTNPVGYESPGSNVHFSDFKRTILSVAKLR